MATGVIGLGNIGGRIAGQPRRRRQRGGRARRRRRRRWRRSAGATAAADVASVARQADVTLLSLPTPDVVVGRGRRRGPAPPRPAPSSSTSPPTARPSCASWGSAWRPRGTTWSRRPSPAGPSAPRSGCSCSWSAATTSPSPASSRCSSRSAAPPSTSAPLGLGNTMKLLNSLIAFTTTWVSLEGLAFATKAGIEVQKAVEILRTAGASNFFIDRQVETIDGRGRPTQFALELAAKDAGLIVELGSDARRPDPGGGRRAGRPRRAPSPKASAVPTGASWSRTPSSRPAWRCAGTRQPLVRPEHVGRHAQGRARRGHAGVDGDVHEDLDDLLARDPDVQRAGQVRAQLLGLAERGQQRRR